MVGLYLALAALATLAFAFATASMVSLGLGFLLPAPGACARRLVIVPSIPICVSLVVAAVCRVP